MLPLFLLNSFLIALIFFALYICQKKITSEKGKRIALIVAASLTIVCHYSSLLYHLIVDGTYQHFLDSNPNLVLPIYPCNVVMWCCLVFALLKKKDGKLRSLLADYIVLFGTASALVGMFANVDFIRDPSLGNFDITKGILAHGFMLFNIWLIPALGEFKLNLNRNLPHIVLSIVGMLFVGLYCNTVVRTIGSAEYAYDVNSMFLLHSPFDGLDFLTYPTIAGIALVLYFGLLSFLEILFYKKGSRWYSRLKRKEI